MGKYKRLKRELAVLLSACMVLGMTPISVRAEEKVSENTVQTGETTSEKDVQTETEAVSEKAAPTEAETVPEKAVQTETETVSEKAAETVSEKAVQTEAETVSEKVVQTETETASENIVQTAAGNASNTAVQTALGESSGVYELTLENGAYYDSQRLKYTLSTDDGTATVSGYDTSYVNDTNFPEDKVEAGEGWKIIIPTKVSYDGVEYEVTKVGNRAFYQCKQLTNAYFQKDSTVNEIERWAFMKCSLKEITLPKSLTNIGDYAFIYNNLNNIYIPQNVSSIGVGICARNTQLRTIKVDSKNEFYNVGLGDVNCIISGNTLIQGCATSIVPNGITTIDTNAFAGIDIRQIDFSGCDKLNIKDMAFTQAILPEDWKIPECFQALQIYGNTSLKRVTIPESEIFLKVHNEVSGLFSGCTNLEAAVIPASVRYASDFNRSDCKELFGGNCGTDNLTVYVGDFSEDNGLFKSLKAHAYEDYTGDEVITYEKTETRHYILKKAYRVQLADEYAGYTLTKAKGCTTLTPIPGDSVRFVINVDDNYKKNVTVYVTDDSGNKTELTKDADGVYTLNNVNESNYKISLENYGECGHENTFTYTLDTDESGNSIIKKVCDDCGYEETGKVTATWRHGVKSADSVAFFCDNAGIKGTYAVTEAVVTGKSVYSYGFTPFDGICTGSGSVTVTEKTEEKISRTTNGITYSTVRYENDITNPLGNCTADIYYDSESAVLHIYGSETYEVSGTTTADRIVVNNTKPATIVLNGLDIQMTALPAIDLQGTADVKLVLAEKTENILKSGGDYAALQKNDLAKNTPKLIIYGPGSLDAEAAWAGAGIGAQSKKTASNIIFDNAIIIAGSNAGCGIGNGSNTNVNDKNFSAEDFIINGGKVEAESNHFWDVSGGITVDGRAAVRGISQLYYSDNFESSTNVKKGFICRYNVIFGKSYCKMQGDVRVDFRFNGDGLEIPENTTLTLEYDGQIFTNSGAVTNNGTFILKGYMRNLDTVTNNGTIYNYAQYGDSLKDKVTGSGTLHEDIDHDGMCDICEAHEDIGNVTISDYNKAVTITQGGTFTISAAVTPKESGNGKEVTYEWYQLGTDGSYTKIKDATTAEYTQDSSSLEPGKYTYRMQALCDGIIRYIPFTVTVKEKINIQYNTHSITLGDYIGVNFYVTIPEAARTEAAYMEFSVSGRGGENTKIKLSDITAEKDGRYKFTCQVNAIEMAETVTAVFHYGENETAGNTYSVREYIETIMADGSQPDYVKNMVRALADYGYYAQRCLAETNGWELDKDYAQMLYYTADIDTTADLSAYAYSCEGEAAGITGVKRSLSLDSKTAINLYFTIDDSLTEAPAVVVKNAEGNAVDYELTLVNNGSRYRLTIPEIYAHKLGEVYTITVNDTMTIRTSALSYAYAVLQSEQMTAAAKKAVAAMYQYYQAAIAYQKMAAFTLNVTYEGVWERWGTNGGKGLAYASWSDIDGTITLNITFNDTVDEVETDDASVQKSWSGNTATFTFAGNATNPLTIGIHLNHGTDIDDLNIADYTYSVK